MSKDGVVVVVLIVPVVTSAVRRFSSSFPLSVEGFIGDETGGERPVVTLGVEPE